MNAPLSIAVMTPSLLDAVWALDRAAFDKPWPKAWFESELNTPNAYGIVAASQDSQGPERAEALTAYACFRILADEMHLMRLAVRPDCRRRGVGIHLLETVCQSAGLLGAASAVLEVRESNIQAAALYRKAGFSLCGRRPNYYPETREAALVMTKRLPRRQHEHENRHQWLWPDRTSSFPGGAGESVP